jgi:uncharacterized membrane protein YdjX (TVP38/TMEM64 family)
MAPSAFSKILAVVVAAVAAGLVLILFGRTLADALAQGWHCLVDPVCIQGRIRAAGGAAPIVFIFAQVLQVLLAPVPGEATGFVGGYLFGAVPGFFYSTVGLTMGSWLNLCIGRAVGRRYVRRLIPKTQLARFDRLLRRQGALAVFMLFLFPGFPKDYLCLFLGLSALPLKLLLVLAAVGRIPGTLVLSLQGAALFAGDIVLLVVSVGVFLGIGAAAYGFRHRFYQWVAKVNGSGADDR